MKKFVFLFALLLCVYGYSQDDNDNDPTAKGAWVIEVNTGSWTTGSTAFSLTSVDGTTIWSIGAEAGYFVTDDLAIKAGIGYADADVIDGTFTYKIGAKYYLSGVFPLGVDFTGISVEDMDANWIGVQGGYALFITDHIAIEPTVRYNITLDEMKADSAFQGLIGFSIFLN